MKIYFWVFYIIFDNLEDLGTKQSLSPYYFDKFLYSNVCLKSTMSV